MTNELNGLRRAYARRALYAGLGLTLAAAALNTSLPVRAQGTVPAQPAPTVAAPATPPATAAPATPPAAAAPAPAPTGTTVMKSKPPRKASLTVVPKPRNTGDKTISPGSKAAPQGTGKTGAPTGGKAAPTAPPANPNLAPPPGGGPQIKFGPSAAGTPFSFDFKGSDIANVLKFYSQMSGLTITTDQAVTGPVTIIAPKPVTLNEAFDILQAVLSVRGFSAVQEGSVLKIVPLDRAITSTTLLNNDPDTKNADPRNFVMTQVIPLDNADAKTLATELLPLINKGASLIGSAGTNSLIITDMANNVQRFIDLARALDGTSSKSELRVYPLKRAESAVIADDINNIYGKITSRGQGGAPPQPGQPGFNPGNPQAPAGGGGRPAVVAVADQRTNSVIVVASPENQDQIAGQIINRLDGDDTNTLVTEIIKLKYSNATDISNLVNTVLSNAHGSGASSQGGSSFQSRNFGGFFNFGGGGGGGDQQTVSSTDPLAKVVADPRTNTLLATASQEKMDDIKRLVASLDVEVPAETTTFVIPLKNAQATDVATTLQQAFGTNSQRFGDTFNFGGRGGTFGPQQRQRIQRRVTDPNSRAAIPRRNRNVPPGPPPSPDDSGAYDPNAPQDNGGSAEPQGVQGVLQQDGSFVPTQNNDAQNNPVDANGKPLRTRQFFFGGGFGQQRGLGQSNSPQYGRGSTGSYVNLLRLQNNVFVQASPNGDSIIVTTTPDNIKAVQDIVNQLDVVPRQVLIEVIVAEVTLTTDQKFGYNVAGSLFRLFNSGTSSTGVLNLPAPGSTSGTSTDPNAGGFQFTLSGTNYTAVLQALDNNNKVKIIATPRVFTANNQQADIEIIQKIKYVSGQESGGFSTTVANQVVDENVGLILNVTPTITRQGLVTIDVVEEASDLARFDVIGTGVSALRVPIVNDRYADTEVTVQDGQTVVIGGLIRDTVSNNVSKIPFLGDLPILGQFFRSREKTRSRQELMIFMTPHVVNNAAESRDLTRQQSEGLVKQLPDIYVQQPNLDYRPKKGAKKPITGPGANGAGTTGNGTGATGSGTTGGTGTGTDPTPKTNP